VNLISDATSTDSAWDRQQWLILGVIGLAQLMVVLDLTLMPRFGPKPLVASGMLAAAVGTAWLAQLGPHTGTPRACSARSSWPQ
jgi:hypothetical protein